MEAQVRKSEVAFWLLGNSSDNSTLVLRGVGEAISARGFGVVDNGSSLTRNIEVAHLLSKHGADVQHRKEIARLRGKWRRGELTAQVWDYRWSTASVAGELYHSLPK
jgi:hypothetical protein